MPPGAVFDPIIPMLAGRCRAIRLRQASVGRARGAKKNCHRREGDKNADKNGRCESRRLVLQTLSLGEELGGNRPQFRRGWGLIRARFPAAGAASNYKES